MSYPISTKLTTKEDLKILEERFNQLDFKLNIIIAIVALSSTFFNSALFDFFSKFSKL